MVAVTTDIVGTAVITRTTHTGITTIIDTIVMGGTTTADSGVAELIEFRRDRLAAVSLFVLFGAVRRSRMAQSGHERVQRTRPLSGAKRTLINRHPTAIYEYTP